MAWAGLAALVLSGCGVSQEEYDAKSKEVEDAKKQAGVLQGQLATDEAQITQLKSAVGAAQSQAMTDEQKAQLAEATDRAKTLDDLQTKFKKMIDAGHLKVTTRHGRVVLQLHNDVLFDTGESEVKPQARRRSPRSRRRCAGWGRSASRWRATPTTSPSRRRRRSSSRRTGSCRPRAPSRW
jgi:flagellar motor protein MotB